MYIRFNETNGRGERGQSVRLGRRVLRLDRLDRRGPRRRRDGRRPVHAPSRAGDVRAAPLRRLAGRAQVQNSSSISDARAHGRVGAVRAEHEWYWRSKAKGQVYPRLSLSRSLEGDSPDSRD